MTDAEVKSFAAENIRSLLNARGWRTSDLVNAIDGAVPQNTVYRIVRGESPGSTAALASIAAVLGVSVDYLITSPEAHSRKR